MSLEATRINDDKVELMRAWSTEKFYPHILPYKDNIVGRLQEEIENARNRLLEQPETNLTTKTIKELEIDRLRFLVISYLRTRLLKIEKHVQYIIETEEMFDRLSPGEQKFAKQYFELQQAHLNTMFLGSIPDVLKAGDEDNLRVEPNLNTYVFCRVREDLGQVDIEGEVVALSTGDIYVLRSGSITPYIEQEQFDLI
ncbi:gins4 [Acrasis kona]|uniref:DNA replication complex GINS protein SLD5 n=1 Tax=Acrasis kona TaxID=1008807 RepID=A0AAW2YJV7_9EUKA